MRNILHDVIEVVKRRLIRPRHQRATHPATRGAYRSSRDTAARTLRDQDAELLGMPVEEQGRLHSGAPLTVAFVQARVRR